jgi:glycosyltransferase involved in cell wall biosynthesis
MKVLHLVQGYYPAIGGTEHLIQQVSEHLVKDFQDQVIVFTTTAYNTEAFNTIGKPKLPVGESLINQVKVRRFPVRNRLSKLFYYPQKLAYRLHLPLNDWLRTWYSGPIMAGIGKAANCVEADIVAASSFPLLHMFYALKFGKQCQCPVVLHGGLHPEDKWGFKRKNIFKAIQRCNAYIANTEYEKAFLVDQGISENKITVIGVGTDIDQLAQANPSNFKKKYHLNGYPLVVFFGQQGGHKGIDTLIKSMPIVWSKISSARLVIAGAKTDYSEQIEQLLSQFPSKQRDKILLLTQFSDNEKPEIIAAADVFASPSGYESFGITYLEAWACGKPVIGTRSGAIPHVIKENWDGLLVNYQDEQELAGAILELLSDKNFAKRLGQNGKKKVKDRFTWKIVASKFRQVYKKAIASFDKKSR